MTSDLSIGGATVEITPFVNPAEFTRKLYDGMEGPTEAALERLGRGIEEMGRKLTLRLTVPIAAGTAINVVAFNRLDKKVRETVTLFGEGGEAADRLWRSMRDGVAGVTDEIGLLEQGVSAGLYQAISAGIPKENVFDFMEIAGRAAVAGSVELLSAVDVLTTATNTFTAQNLTAAEAADILFRTVARGKTTFGELQRDMATVAPLAAAAGMTFQELNTAVATMTLVGTGTSEAFTQIKAALTGLLRPSEDMEKLFQGAGFASQAAAVGALGYQGALQVLFEATEGEVGALIKLLGGAEAANAALQVTGKNAATFASIMDDVSTAAGASTTAFEIMDAGGTRTFEKLRAELGQISDHLGDVAMTIVGPLVRGFTSFLDVLSDIAGVFARSPTWVKVLVGGMVGILGLVGPLLAGFGALMQVFPFISTAILFRLVPALNVLKLSFLTLGYRALKTLGIMKTVQVSMAKNAANLAKTTSLALLKQGAILAAITATIIAWQKYNEWLGRIDEREQVLTRGVNKLAKSLDLLVGPIGEITEAGDTTLTFDFRVENANLIQEMRDAQDDGTLDDKIVQISYRLQQLGNTPEDIQEAIDKLLEAAHIDVEIEVSLVSPSTEDFVDAVLRDLEHTFAGAAPFQADVETPTLFTGPTEGANSLNSAIANLIPNVREYKASLTEVAQQVTDLANEGRYTEMQRLWAGVNEKFGDTSNEMDFINDQILKFIDSGRNIGFVTDGFTGMANALSQIEDKTLIVSSAEAERLARLYETDAAQDAYKESVLASAFALREMGHSARFSEEEIDAQMKTIDKAGGTLENTMDRMGEKVRQTFDSIRDKVREQVPLWGEYEGAVRLSVRKLTTSLDKFIEDTAAWSETSQSLIGKVPSVVREKLDEMPLAQRAALSKLAEEAPAQFDKLIAKYEEAFGKADAVAETQFQEKLPAIIAEGNRLLASTASELEDTFGDIGENVALAWKTRFESEAANWDFVVRRYATSAVSAMNWAFGIDSPSKVFAEIGLNAARGFEIGLQTPVTLPPIRLQPSGGGGDRGATTRGDVIVNIVNPDTYDLNRDSQRAGLIIGAAVH